MYFKDNESYSRAFHAMMGFGEEPIVPVINAVFQTNYESYELDFRNLFGNDISVDYCMFVICHSKVAHVWFFDSKDEDLLEKSARLVLSSALENMKRTKKGNISFNLPKSGIILFRDSFVPFDGNAIKIYSQRKQLAQICVPVFSLSDFSLNEIQERNLKFILPFLPYRLEKYLVGSEMKIALRVFDELMDFFATSIIKDADWRYFRFKMKYPLYVIDYVWQEICPLFPDEARRSAEQIFDKHISRILDAEQAEIERIPWRDAAYTMFVEECTPAEVARILQRAELLNKGKIAQSSFENINKYYEEYKKKKKFITWLVRSEQAKWEEEEKKREAKES